MTQLEITNADLLTELDSENDLEIQATGSSRSRKTRVGFRVGAGIEYLFSRTLGLSRDYIFSDYGKIKTRTEGQNTGFFDFNQVYGVLAPEVTLMTQTLMAGITLHF